MPQSFNVSNKSEPELMTDAEMQTSRGEMPTNETILNSLKFRHPEATEGQMQNAVNVLVGIFQVLAHVYNSIYKTVGRSGFISKEVVREYNEITGDIATEGRGRKRATLLRELADHYRENIYDKYISDIANRPFGVQLLILSN